MYFAAVAVAEPWKAAHATAWFWGQALAVVSVVLGARAVGGSLADTVAWRRPAAGWGTLAPWAVWTMAAYLLFAATCAAAWPGAGGDSDRYAELSRAILARPWLLLVPVGVLAPLGEELLFRGAGLTLLGQGGRRTLAIAVTSLLFAAGHVEPYKLLPTAFLGVVLARVAWASGSIGPGLVVHIGVNSFVVLALLAAGTAVTLDPPAAATAALGWPAVAALAGLSGLLMLRCWRATGRIEAACETRDGRRHGARSGTVLAPLAGPDSWRAEPEGQPGPEFTAGPGTHVTDSREE